MGKRIELITERLIISPLSDLETFRLIKATDDPETKGAYFEMLKGSMDFPKRRLWYTPWKMTLKDGSNDIIGDLCFKGPQKGGAVEIGYGIKPEYEGHGYMTEAAAALIEWAFSQYCVFRVYAETEPTNAASQRILEKLNFKPCNVMGEEGPIFVCINPKADYSNVKKMFSIGKCTVEDAKEFCTWRYEGEYSVYNFSSWEEVCANGWDLASDETRERNYVSVRLDGELFGFYNIMNRGDRIELGVGIRPDMCGKHYGEAFVRLAVNTIEECHPEIPIFLTVRPFNKRAIKCYENCGFEIIKQYYETKYITPGEMYLMKLKH